MISTSRLVTVGINESIIDTPIILYRGDRDVDVEFTINGNKYMFSHGGNVIQSTKASFGQMVINTPSGNNMFSKIEECEDGKVMFTITKEMIDELIEVGFYSFQIRLYDSTQIARVTLPPVYRGIDIRNPIAAEDETNITDIGLADYSVVRDDPSEELYTFLPNGAYNKTEWSSRDIISKNKLNKIEDALYNINDIMESRDLSIINKLEKMEKIEERANEHITEFVDAAEAEIEELERELNKQFELFKIDVDSVMVDHKYKNGNGMYGTSDYDLSTVVTDSIKSIRIQFDPNQNIKLPNFSALVKPTECIKIFLYTTNNDSYTEEDYVSIDMTGQSIFGCSRLHCNQIYSVYYNGIYDGLQEVLIAKG